MSRIHKRGNWWHYEGRGRDRKKLVRISLRTRDRKEAVKRQKELDRLAWEGKLGLVVSRASLSEFVQDYLKYSQTNKAPETFNVDRFTLESFLDFAGDLRLDRVDARLIEDWKTARRKTVSSVTVNRDLRHLKVAFSTAIKWTLLRENPLRDVRPIPVDERKPVVLSQEDVDALFDHLRQDVQLPVWIALYTGMRRGEVVNLHWSDVDWDRRVIHVVNRSIFHTKSRKEGVVPVNSILYDMLVEAPKTDLQVWPQTPRHLTRQFKKAVRAAGLSDRIHFHTLRHTFVTTLANAGVPLWDIQRAARHSSIELTQGYAHFQDERLHQVVAELDFTHRTHTTDKGRVLSYE